MHAQKETYNWPLVGMGYMLKFHGGTPHFDPANGIFLNSLNTSHYHQNNSAAISECNGDFLYGFNSRNWYFNKNYNTLGNGLLTYTNWSSYSYLNNQQNYIFKNFHTDSIYYTFGFFRSYIPNVIITNSFRLLKIQQLDVHPYGSIDTSYHILKADTLLNNTSNWNRANALCINPQRNTLNQWVVNQGFRRDPNNVDTMFFTLT